VEPSQQGSVGEIANLISPETARELFFLRRLRSLRLGNQIDAERVKHLNDRGEFRLRFSA
jgi:hypothetical protein